MLLAALGTGVTVGLARLSGQPARPAPSTPSAPPQATAAPPSPAGPPACAPKVTAMPLRARLAQRLMVGLDPSEPNAAQAVTVNQVGGVFLGGDPSTVLKSDTIAALQAKSTIPLAVAIDEEGGRVQRIKKLDGSIPSARQMAATMSPDQVRALGEKRGRQLRAYGITVDLAPDLDVDGGPADGAIGDRSFSADPTVVARYAGAFAAGLRDAGVLPVFKHFPGHGRASGDSHAGLVTTPPLSALRADDLKPYRALLNTAPAAVMVGHLNVPGLTNGQAASLSPKAYQLLRQEFGFSGLAMTDDLGAMKAITDRYALPEAVLTAFQAGADMALWTSTAQLDAVLDRLEAAVRTGQLTEDSVNAATARVLAGKGLCVT